MKKIKEFIKKIGNKKYCLLSLLLAGLLLFAIVGGLNGSKSAKTEVNAISAPTTKNLDLNGIRYTYQTSLKELKNSDLFVNWYYNRMFSISEDSEGLVQFLLGGQEDRVQLTETEISSCLNEVDNSFKLYDSNKDELIEGWENVNNQNISNNIHFDATNYAKLDNLKKLYIDFKRYANIPHNFEYGYGSVYDGFILTFVYVPESINVDATKEEFAEKSIFYNYCFSRCLNNFEFDVINIDGYDLRQIYCMYESDEETEENAIYNSVTTSYIYAPENDSYEDAYTVIDNIKFIENQNSNIVTFNSNFNYNSNYALYKGNILLSETKYDEKFVNDISSLSNSTEEDGIVNLLGGYFGGNFNNNKPSGQILYSLSEVITNPIDRNIIEVYTNPNYIGFMILNQPGIKKVMYYGQNRLLYLENLNTLRGNFKNNNNYNGLSAQVEDILYNVNYVGNIEEEEFNQKVQEDFENLAKTTGLGAFIGLIVGILFGVPGIGALWGAAGGFLVGIIPLIIDALQSIFGKNFLSGLYNFFKSITNFFVGIVDSIFNFLISIITNPFILITIIIVVLLYIFVVRPKIK